MFIYSTARRILKDVRLFMTSSTIRNYYDALGLTTSATQSDIKAAYYKLSKLYHPDISKDEESAKRFREITEAYEILGNITLKKLYDKGILVDQDSESGYKPEPEETDPTLRFYKSRDSRLNIKKSTYDFDAWSKKHYGYALHKTLYVKEHLKKKSNSATENKESISQGIKLTLFLGILVVITFMFSGNIKNNQSNQSK